MSEGRYQLVYIGPEMLIGKDVYREMLLNNLYQRNLVAFVVDKAHCIKSWGAKFRDSFRRLGEARSLVHPTVNVMALTATAVYSSRSTIKRTLGMSSRSCEVVASPIKRNIKFVSCKNTKSVKDCLHPLVEELIMKRTKLLRTLQEVQGMQ